MRSTTIRVILAGLSLLACATAWGRSAHFNPATMMSTSEIRRGMTGIGKSVFSGVEIEEFDIEVLGVLSKANLGGDLILVRVTSGSVVERQSGIIGGMSGSPVYVKGRLLGAIAYAWSFAREPIAGVTAIESMLEAYEGEEETEARLRDDHPARGAQVAGRWVEEAHIVQAARSQEAFAGPDTLNMQPVAPLVYASGLRGCGMERLRELLRPYGMEPLAGPGRKRPSVPTELRPGAAVGISFVSGSFDIDGIGTVTYRDGDTILAFGHPMMELGSVEIPLTTAWVHELVPSIARSNKLASAMETVGALTRDATWSVGGKIGAEARTVPARISVTDEDRGVTRAFEFEVVRQQMLTPSMLMSVLGGSMAATFNSGGKGIGSIEFTVRGEQGAEIKRRDVVWHPGHLGYVAQWVDEALYIMTENRFEPQQVASLEARVSLTGKDRSAAIERIYTEENVARAGKELTVHVVIRPEGGKPVEKTVKFSLPESLPKGTLRVGAAAGMDEWSLRNRLRLLFPQFYSLEDIAKLIESMKRSDQLFVAAGLPDITLSVQGTALPRLPREAALVLADSARTDVTAGLAELTETLDTEWVLYGWDYIRIPTEDRKGERGKVSRKESEEDEEDEEHEVSVTDGTAEVTEGMQEAREGRGHALPGAVSSLQPLVSSLRRLLASAFEREMGPADEPGLPDELGRETQPEAPARRERDAEIEEEEGEEEEDTGEHPEPDGEVLSRQPSTWTQDSAEHFDKGKAEGVLVRSDGTLVLAPGSEVLADADEPYIWSVAVGREDAVYYGTANPGRIYRWNRAEGAKLAHSTGEFAVLSLLACDDGSLLAGTGPNGKLFRIAAEGKAELAYDLPVSYVWALAAAPGGAIVAGTGPHGRIYRLGDDGDFSLMATISQPHVLAFAVAAGALYAAGGDEQGGVFRISESGAVTNIFGSDEHSCTGLAADEQGRLYVSTASDGKVFCIEPRADGRRAREVFESDDGDLLDVIFADGRAYAASSEDAKIIAADAEKRSGVAYKDKLAAQALCLATGEDGTIYAGTAAPARLIRLDLRGEVSGRYESAVLDAERVSRWARIFWDAETPEGTGLEVFTRSGNSEVAEDGSWGRWSHAYAEVGAELVSAATRYLQYRLMLTGRDSKTPQVHRVAVVYLPGNQPPTLAIDDPEPGESVRAEYRISWDAEDDDDDTLLTTIFLKPHGSDEGQAVAGAAAAAQTQWEQIAEVLDDDYYHWDTTDLEDGRYSLKLVCTDLPSNPIGAESAEEIIQIVTVDQGYPRLILFGHPEVDEEKSATFHGVAADDLTRITSIDWCFEEQAEWRAAPPDDGLLDSRREAFSIKTGPIPEGETAMQVRLRDAAGNVTVRSLPLNHEPEEEQGAAPEGETPEQPKG